MCIMNDDQWMFVVLYSKSTKTDAVSLSRLILNLKSRGRLGFIVNGNHFDYCWSLDQKSLYV